ncbi:MAG TPA: hypothetical protein VE619_11650 [Nitrososphaeraceae archaeon]|nr:hypothetical protein [Nitrososphaeraceae archaeon]
MKPKTILVAEVLKAISDNRSLELFKIIALEKQDTKVLIIKTRLSRKQYYSRMSGLMHAGLIIRKHGKYTLTSFGKIIYYIVKITIENAINYYWKLKAIDSLGMSDDIPAEEHKKIIDSFIDNQEIKNILISYDSRFEHKSCADAGQQCPEQLARSLLIS